MTKIIQFSHELDVPYPWENHPRIEDCLIDNRALFLRESGQERVYRASQRKQKRGQDDLGSQPFPYKACFCCSVKSCPTLLWLCGLQQARFPCPSPSPRVCSNSCPLSQGCHPTILASAIPYSSCPQSFPASGSFPTSQLLASGGHSIAASAYKLSRSYFPGWGELAKAELGDCDGRRLGFLDSGAFPGSAAWLRFRFVTSGWLLQWPPFSGSPYVNYIYQCFLYRRCRENEVDLYWSHIPDHW